MRQMQWFTISPGCASANQLPAKSGMDQFVRTARVPQGACQHARHSAYAMCYAASERLAWQSLLTVRLVTAVLRALIDLMLLFHFLVLIVLLAFPRVQQVLALLMDDGAGAASLR